MTLTEKKEKLRNELNKLKSDGLRVFISKSDYYAYGLMTDGKNIIYVQYSTYKYTACWARTVQEKRHC